MYILHEIVSPSGENGSPRFFGDVQYEKSKHEYSIEI